MREIDEDVERFYQDVIMRHSRTPAHGVRPSRFDCSGVGENMLCGDHVTVFVSHDANQRLGDVGFEAHGCAISIAAADLMAGLLRGVDEATALRLSAAFRRVIETGQADPADEAALAALLPLRGVHDYPSRRRCALLPWEALEAALTRQAEQAA